MSIILLFQEEFKSCKQIRIFIRVLHPCEINLANAMIVSALFKVLLLKGGMSFRHPGVLNGIERSTETQYIIQDKLKSVSLTSS